MTTQQVADRFDELAQQGAFDKIVNELFASDCQSIEPSASQGLSSVQGLDAIRAKGVKFNEAVEEMHGGYSTKPIVASSFFAVTMGMDVTMKGMGRMKMDEIALYEVKDGKIIREQFFYDAMPKS
ncbi:MAG TPA: SnoaL-like domain-containing protein [Phnomibacter sp.]|nr:SnoaL-like domain-containing protein [Phnomibacter sp.]